MEDSKRSAETCLDVFEDFLKVSFFSASFGGPRFLAPADIQFIDTWEAESYPRSVAKSGAARGRMEGKIALVPGLRRVSERASRKASFAKGPTS